MISAPSETTPRTFRPEKNAAIISGYPGNPEANNYNRQTGPLAPGYDASPYPVARIFTIGTQVGF